LFTASSNGHITACSITQQLLDNQSVPTVLVSGC